MRMDGAAVVSRSVFAMPVGFRFTFKAGLAACMLGPRHSYPAGQNHPCNDVHRQDKAEQNESRSPCLTLPVFVGRKCVNVNHVRQGFDLLGTTRTPITIAERRE